LDAIQRSASAFKIDEVDEFYTESRTFRDEWDSGARRPVQPPVIRRKLVSAEPGRETAMRRMAIVAAALTAAGSAQAEMPSAQAIFCAQLNRTVQIAQMAGDFDHLERSRAAPPYFGFRHGCRAHAATARSAAAWWCHQSLAPDELSLESLAGRTAACLPSAVRSRGRWGDEAIFTLPRARIVIEESGGPRAHVGRIVTFRVEAARP
jgi:hypothetical protein